MATQQDIVDQLQELNDAVESIGTDLLDLFIEVHATLQSLLTSIGSAVINGNVQLLDALKTIDEDILSSSSSEEGGEKGGEKKSRITKIFETVQKTVTNLYKLISKGVREALARGRELSKFNGQLAAQFAVSDIKQLFRDIKLAQSTAGSTVGLQRQVDKLLDALLPITSDLTNATNAILANAVAIATKVAELYTDIRGFILEILETIPFFKDFVMKAKKWIADNEARNPVHPAQNAVSLWAMGDFGKTQDPLFRPGGP
jgi:hypothetical protein